MRARPTPMTWLLASVAVVHGIGIGWGLPASDGWDNDGVAPRDFLPGLAETFTPGHFYTYPPVHLALLAVLTLPVTLVGVLRAPSHALPDLIGELLKPGYMTTIALLARLVSLLMSLGIALFGARIVEEIRALQLGAALEDPRVRRVGYWAVVFLGAERSIAYYAHTTNLDVPYLFWAMLSLLGFARAIARSEPRRLRRAFLFAVLAIGTKDQAYAIFGLAVPIALAIWFFGERGRPDVGRTFPRELGVAIAGATGLLLVADAIVFNPTGFAARLRFLTGSASGDFVEYTRDWSGRLGVLVDAGRYFDAQLPAAVALLGLGGLVLAVRRARGALLAVALLPLVVGLSFTILFNWVSLRTNARFLIPQATMLALYAALAADALWSATQRYVRIAGRLALGATVAVGLYGVIAVDANLVFDGRYDAEEWMRQHVKPGETIETYGLNVYLPRFPEGAKVIRVGPEPLAGRNPLPGVTEVQDAYEHAPARDAHWIVLSAAWGWRYLLRPEFDLGAGRRLAPTQQRTIEDEAAARWFRRLTQNEDAFEFRHHADYPYEKWLPIYQIHGTTGAPIWIYERKPEVHAP